MAGRKCCPFVHRVFDPDVQAMNSFMGSFWLDTRCSFPFQKGGISVWNTEVLRKAGGMCARGLEPAAPVWLMWSTVTK